MWHAADFYCFYCFDTRDEALPLPSWKIAEKSLLVPLYVRLLHLLVEKNA
jgi:hypothetical protein